MRILGNPCIICNRLKVDSVGQNTKPLLKDQKQSGGFDAYVWRFVDGQPNRSGWRSFEEIPAAHGRVRCKRKAPGKRGFSFTASTIR